MSEEKKLLVSAIKNGTVIDHITAGAALKVIGILNLTNHNNVVTVGINLPSKTFKNKDIIKVAERELTPEEVNRVAIFAPKASINIIRNYNITKKFIVKTPEKIDRMLICPNPKCITNHEAMDSSFKVVPNGHATKLRCQYCEKIFVQDDIKNFNLN